MSDTKPAHPSALRQMAFLAPDEARPTNRPGARADLWLLLMVAVILVVWGLCVALFGLPGLYLPALMLVPLIMLLLVRATWG